MCLCVFFICLFIQFPQHVILVQKHCVSVSLRTGTVSEGYYVMSSVSTETVSLTFSHVVHQFKLSCQALNHRFFFFNINQPRHLS